jgi:hypothetical protein
LTDPGMEHRSLSAHCEAAARLGARLGMPDAVCYALAHAYERWDGKAHPAGFACEDVRSPSGWSPSLGTPRRRRPSSPSARAHTCHVQVVVIESAEAGKLIADRVFGWAEGLGGGALDEEAHRVSAVLGLDRPSARSAN